MDVNALIKKMNDFQSQGIDKYKFANKEDIVLVISGLRGLHKFELAIELYQKYEMDLQDPDIYPVALTNIIEVCNDSKTIPLLIKYTKELKAIYPDHPYVIEISKFHTI